MEPYNNMTGRGCDEVDGYKKSLKPVVELMCQRNTVTNKRCLLEFAGIKQMFESPVLAPQNTLHGICTGGCIRPVMEWR